MIIRNINNKVKYEISHTKIFNVLVKFDIDKLFNMFLINLYIFGLKVR